MKRLKALAATYYARLLLAFLAFAIVPLLTLGLLTYGFARLALEESAASRAIDDMHRLSEGMDALIAQHTSALDILCDDDDIRTFLEQEDEQDYYRSNYKLMLTVGGNDKNAAAHIVSAKSPIGATTRSIPLEYMYPHNSGWGIFRKAGATNQAVVHVNDSQVAAATGANISLAQSIRDANNELLGYAVIDVKRSALSMLLPEKGDEITFIINWKSFVVFCSRGTDYEGLNRALAAVQAEVKKVKSGAPDAYYKQGDERTILVSMAQPATGFTLVSEISRATIAGNIRIIRNAIISITALMLLLCPLVAALAAKNVAAPLRELTALMGKVESGDFSARTNFTRTDDIGVLGRAFDTMTMRINQLVDRVAREQKSLRLAQLHALQAQINPHFIYNTLDLIKYKAMLGEVDDVSAITVQLGRMLRYLANTKDDLVAVSFELDFISQYIDIQKRRYDQRLEVNIDIDPAIMDAKIPKLILQPAVENAFVHGLENKLNGGILTITGRKVDGLIVFTISDNGAGIEHDRLEQVRREYAEDGNRIGLSNVQGRARLHGDERCGVRLDSDPGIGTTITITVLAREQGFFYD